MCRAWHGLHSSTLHRIVTSFTVHSSHCIAPHRIATWCIASILFVGIAYRFVQYSMATQSIGSHRLASPCIAHAQHRSCITSYHIESPRSGSHHIIPLWHRIASHRTASSHIRTVWQRSACIGSDRIASHRIAHVQHRIASHVHCCPKQGLSAHRSVKSFASVQVRQRQQCALCARTC